MTESFEIVLSKAASAQEIRLALASSVPDEKLDIQTGVEDLAFESNVLSATIDKTADSLWPCVVSIWICPDDLGLGEYPEIQIATRLCQALNCNALSFGEVSAFVESIDPRDPYYSLALVDGGWYLASTAGTPLMGPYTDGTRSFPGDATVRLVRPIDIPQNVAGTTPNPSIERTRPGKPGRASHVKR